MVVAVVALVVVVVVVVGAVVIVVEEGSTPVHFLLARSRLCCSLERWRSFSSGSIVMAILRQAAVHLWHIREFGKNWARKDPFQAL